MEVEVKKVMGWDIALDDALWTVRKPLADKEPSSKWKTNLCFAEHSMLADIRFVVNIKDAPCWASQHIARHDVFAGHTLRESKEVHYVSTSRTDRTGINRNKLPQDAPVDHRISLSAKDFITISRLRLCNCASKETREIWSAIIEELRKVEPELAACCVPNCVYRGFCPEFETCGYAKGKVFEEKLSAYRALKK